MVYKIRKYDNVLKKNDPVVYGLIAISYPSMLHLIIGFSEKGNSLSNMLPCPYFIQYKGALFCDCQLITQHRIIFEMNSFSK